LKLGLEAFDQNAGMTLDLVKPLIVPRIRFIELAVNLFEPLVDPLESPIQPSDEPTETFIKILNKFLVHTASRRVKE
jgi:hypothetical protein